MADPLLETADRMNVFEIIEQIEQDFAERREPFDDIEFPEERLLRLLKVQAGSTEEPAHFSKEERLRIVSLFSMFDYNRDANQLVDNLLELHDREPSWFDPVAVPASEEAVEEVFAEIGFRYPSRDAHALVSNAQIVLNNYSGNWTELLLDAGCDAERFVQLLRDEGFLYLKGDKIAPMYARIISDEVADLDNLWALEIPVDTHIRRLSKQLFRESIERLLRHDARSAEDWLDDDDFIRDTWQSIGERYDIDRHIVDGALWQIGNNWDEWGEDYWQNKLNG